MITKQIGTRYLLSTFMLHVLPLYGEISHENTQQLARKVIYTVMDDCSHKDDSKQTSQKLPSTIQLNTSFHVDSDWTTGYQITVTVANPSSSPTTSWAASFNVENSQEQITDLWNANYIQSGTLVNVTNPSWIGGEVIPAGGSTTFGFVVRNSVSQPRTLANLQATGTTKAPSPQPPLAPVLNPISTTMTSNNYTVSWNAVANATLYTLQQSTTSNFTNPTVVSQSANTSRVFTNQPNGTYFYRVFASNTAGNSPFSNVRSVIINVTQILDAPVLNPISQSSTNQANYTVSWSTVANATSYTLQQSTTSNFATPTVVFQGTGTSKAFANQPNGTYFYRVFASNASGNSPFSNVRSVSVNVTPVLAAPVVNPISQSSTNPANYTVSWNSVANATSYTLQQSTTSNFISPTVVSQGTSTSKVFTNQPNGTFFYRVFASNASGNSPFSNVRSVTVNVPIRTGVIVEGYWESWNSNDSINSIVSMKSDIIDVAFVTFNRTGTHTFSVIGLDASQATLTQFITAGHAAGRKVKISVGGATYGQEQFLQSTQDALGLAQAISQFVQQNSLDGVDFDIEDYPAANLQIALLQNTRQLLGNNAIISYTAKTPASSTAPYTQVIVGGYQYFNYVSIMAYDAFPGYNYQQDVQALISMGVPASKIVVGFMPGFDDVGAHTSLSMISSACQYILNKNLHGIMFWDLNRDLENITGLGASAATNTSWGILHP